MLYEYALVYDAGSMALPILLWTLDFRAVFTYSPLWIRRAYDLQGCQLLNQHLKNERWSADCPICKQSMDI